MPATLRELLIQLAAQGVTDHRRYGAVRKFLSFKAREKAQPISGTFELTPLCNLDCKMCYVHLNKDQMQGAQLLSVDQWKDIMQQAVDAGMMYARITGGECLTYPGFRELYMFLRNRGVETAILSNGILLDEEMTDFLKENPPAEIQVTLYGASEDAYERVTGKRVFSRVVENIRRLRDGKFPLIMAVTPNAYMTDGEDVIRFLTEEKFPFNLNSGLMAPRKETGRDVADADIDTYIRMTKLQFALKGKLPEVEEDPEGLPDIGGNQSENIMGVGCGAGRSNFSVDWQGKMRPCNNFPCEAVSVADLGFAEAWRRTNYTATHYPQPVECRGCAYQGVCKHCVAEHAAGAPCGHASPSICAMGRRMVEEGLLKLKQS